MLEAISDQLLDAGPDQGCAGDSAVRIAVDDAPTLALGASAANPKLVFDGSVAPIVGGIAGVERDFHEAISLFPEAFAGFALPFGFNEVLCGLSRKYADEFNEARVVLRRMMDDSARRWFENQPHPFRCRLPRACHNAILAVERSIRLADKTGPETAGFECEIAGMAAFSIIERRPSSHHVVANRR